MIALSLSQITDNQFLKRQYFSPQNTMKKLIFFHIIYGRIFINSSFGQNLKPIAKWF
jgi:hypothetical protein